MPALAFLFAITLVVMSGVATRVSVRVKLDIAAFKEPETAKSYPSPKLAARF